jgi:glycosyltransferase involved in cell wall biosynthesis
MVLAKPAILLLTDFYLPGYKGGGPIRTLASMVHILGDEYHLSIITRDRDLGDTGPYPGIKVNAWQKVGKAEVFYVSPENITLRYLRCLINSTDYDTLYLNSFFSPGFTIIPQLLLRLGLIQKKTTIVAPRGQFSPGALKIKMIKKRLYIYLSKQIGLYRNTVWHASSVYEARDIKAVMDKVVVSIASNLVVIAPDLSIPKLPERGLDQKEKKTGNLRVVFLSRISPMKNLDGALRMLQGLRGEIVFNIYGPLEDEKYWKNCQRIIDTLPSNIKVHYKGPIGYEKVAEVFSDNDLFFLPTHGENYGHAIIEALVSGCPVLISDQTPWRDLATEGVGWDISLSQPERFTNILQLCVDMGNDDLCSLSRQAREYGITKSIDQELVRQNRELLNQR